MTDYLNYIYSIASRGSKPGLERIEEVLWELGRPQDDIKVINVTGTNGKGSYCKMLGDILSGSSYRTGVFSSPHLERINECITIDGSEISDGELSAVIEEIYPFCEKHLLTQFEVLTVACILYFKQKCTDIAIMEVGMGGRLDATNVFAQNILSAILGISLDHTSYLGDSLVKIADEKSGIMKSGCPVFLGHVSPEVKELIESKASILGCPVFYGTGSSEIIEDDIGKTVFSYEGKVYTLKSGAEYQVENAKKVLASLNILESRGYKISQDAVFSALESFYRPARFEVFSQNPCVIFDGGHNPECTQALVKDIIRNFGEERLTAIVGVMADKDVGAICSSVCKIADTVYTVTPNNPRALDCKALAQIFTSKGVNAVSAESFRSALNLWNKKSPLICVGSLYSYAEFKEAFSQLKL